MKLHINIDTLFTGIVEVTTRFMEGCAEVLTSAVTVEGAPNVGVFAQVVAASNKRIAAAEARVKAHFLTGAAGKGE